MHTVSTENTLAPVTNHTLVVIRSSNTSKTRTSNLLIRDLLFADDCALLTYTVDDIQAITNAFARSARRFGLTISLKKTEVIYQPKPGADYTAPTITIDNNPLNVVDKFTYLGSTISQNALIDDEMSARIGKASGRSAN